MKKKIRFILTKDELEIGSGASLIDISKILGCSYQYVYKNIKKDGKLKYKKECYSIIDRLA